MVVNVMIEDVDAMRRPNYAGGTPGGIDDMISVRHHDRSTNERGTDYTTPADSANHHPDER